MKLTFEINGRRVRPGDVGDAFEATILKAIEENVRSKLAGVRDPETGEFPVVAARGSDLDNLSFEIGGSPQLIALAKQRLEAREDGMQEEESAAMTSSSPYAFVCHSSEDNALARRLASDFRRQGIDAFFDEWEIGPGDSLRQKIDEGLGRCTHFIALLTPSSITKSWVNAEIDAGFVAKVNGQCRFLPIRHNLDLDELTPLLRSLYSPSIDGYDEALPELISFIHGFDRKPPLGPAPRPIREQSASGTGLSPAGEMVARLLAERSENGCALDPMIAADQVRQETGLTDDDIADAYDELVGRGLVHRDRELGCGPIGFSTLMPESALFVALDRCFRGWDPEEDALQIAADLVGGAADGDIASLAHAYGWPPRRMNPAVNFLIERGLVASRKVIGTRPWCVRSITKSHQTRRFVKDHS